MKKYILTFVFASLLIACSTVPITGRKQVDFVGMEQILPSSLARYEKELRENKLSKDAAAIAMVNRVGYKLSAVVDKYLRKHGKSAEADMYQWEFNLFDKDEENAWCLPGGKVAIYTGILPLTENEAGLAAVMGHEIAHAFAHHGEERMSEGMLAQLGGVAVAVTAGVKDPEHQAIWDLAYGLGSSLGMLAFSRTHEREADRLGMVFMAMAGYDPEEAIHVWERMAARGKAQPPVILNTHPSDAQRVADLKAFLPEARRLAAELSK